MAVDFFLSELVIEGFRGIKELSLSLTNEQPSILIGPNNSGKSSVLDAIGLCLASGKFMKYSVDECDFYKAKGGVPVEEFLIEIKFTATPGNILPHVKGGLGNPVEAHGIRVTGKLATLQTECTLIDASGDDLLVNKGTPISAAEKDKFKGTGLGGGRRYARLYDIKGFLPDVWHLDPKNLFASLYEWKTGPLQKLLKHYKEKLLSEEWDTPSGKKMPKALHDAHRFLSQQAIKTPFWETELSPKLVSKLQEYLGTSSSIDITPALNPVDAWILSEFLIQIAPGDNISAIDCKRLGDGWQSLLRLVSLEVVIDIIKDNKKALLLIEEPETYLHPHLRRKLRKVFSKLQARGHQVIATTHSEELISFSEEQAIVRLTMTAAGTQKHVYSTATTEEAIKDEEKLSEHGNHEFIFANRVILTEGKGDQFAVKLALDKKDIDCDASSISIVKCGSVDNIPTYAQICSTLGIPWLAIHDKDIVAGGGQKANTARVRALLEQIKETSSLILEWDNDLEDVTGRAAKGSGKASPVWLLNEWRSKTWTDLKSDTSLNKFTSVLDAIESWLKA